MPWELPKTLAHDARLIFPLYNDHERGRMSNLPSKSSHSFAHEETASAATLFGYADMGKTGQGFSGGLMATC